MPALSPGCDMTDASCAQSDARQCSASTADDVDTERTALDFWERLLVFAKCAATVDDVREGRLSGDVKAGGDRGILTISPEVGKGPVRRLAVSLECRIPKACRAPTKDDVPPWPDGSLALLCAVVGGVVFADAVPHDVGPSLDAWLKADQSSKGPSKYHLPNVGLVLTNALMGPWAESLIYQRQPSKGAHSLAQVVSTSLACLGKGPGSSPPRALILLDSLRPLRITRGPSADSGPRLSVTVHLPVKAALLPNDLAASGTLDAHASALSRLPPLRAVPPSLRLARVEVRSSAEEGGQGVGVADEVPGPVTTQEATWVTAEGGVPLDAAWATAFGAGRERARERGLADGDGGGKKPSASRKSRIEAARERLRSKKEGKLAEGDRGDGARGGVKGGVAGGHAGEEDEEERARRAEEAFKELMAAEEEREAKRAEADAAAERQRQKRALRKQRRAERSSATETGTAGARLAECEGALGEEGPWDQARRRGSAKESDDACDETPRNGLRGSEGGEGRGGGEGEGDGGGESGDSGSEVHHADSGSGQSGGRDGGGDSDGLNEGSDRVDPPRDGSESPCATPMGHGKPLPSRGVSSALVASSGSAPAPLLAAAVKVADVGAVVRPVTGGSRVRLTPEADKTDNGYGNDDEHVGGVRRDDSAGGRDVGASGHDGVRGGRGRVVAVEKRVAATGAVTGRASGIDNAGAGAETRVGRGGGGAGYLGKETTWLERGGPMGKDLPGERIESREGRWPRVVSVQPERESPAGLVERLEAWSTLQGRLAAMAEACDWLRIHRGGRDKGSRTGDAGADPDAWWSQRVASALSTATHAAAVDLAQDTACALGTRALERWVQQRRGHARSPGQRAKMW